MASDYKEIEAVSVASNHGIANLPGKKKGLYSLFRSKQPSHGCKKSRTVCSKRDQGVHAKCYLKHKCL